MNVSSLGRASLVLLGMCGVVALVALSLRGTYREGHATSWRNVPGLSVASPDMVTASDITYCYHKNGRGEMLLVSTSVSSGSLESFVRRERLAYLESGGRQFVDTIEHYRHELGAGSGEFVVAVRDTDPALWGTTANGYSWVARYNRSSGRLTAFVARGAQPHTTP